MSRSKAGSLQGSGASRGRSRTSRRRTSGEKAEGALTRCAPPPTSSRDYSIIEVEVEDADDGDEVESYWGDAFLENWARSGTHRRSRARPAHSSSNSSSSYRFSSLQQQRRPAEGSDLLAGLPPSDWFVGRPHQPAALNRSFPHHLDRTSQTSSSYGYDRPRYEVNCGICGRSGAVGEISWAPMAGRSSSHASRQSYVDQGRRAGVGYETRVIAPDYVQGQNA